jgi:tetratricopeptide (TPR) repeat protein
MWLQPPTGEVCSYLARALCDWGKLDEAAAFFEKALELEPETASYLYHWTKLEESRGCLDKAWALFERAEQLAPTKENALLGATLLRRRGLFESALKKLDEIKLDRKPSKFRTLYYYEKALSLDRLEQYDNAFAALDNFNGSRRGCLATAYDAQKNHRLFDDFKRFFTADNMQAMPFCAGNSKNPAAALPLFIVGYPRSGTTLLEQMLTSHPDVSAGDELNYLQSMGFKAPRLLQQQGKYPEFLQQMGPDALAVGLRDLREFYLCNAIADGILDSDTRFFTDKMPFNEMHLGLINLIFREAPIVHMIRHPLDAVLSAYFNYLAHGDNCSYHLESAARHYALVFDLVQHYKANLQMRYLPLRYEDLVESPETHMREIHQFVGVEWDASCLEFHSNTRYARTASYAQVTEKLYTRSVYRYRHYLKHLEPVIPILEPAIVALGYSIDY